MAEPPRPPERPPECFVCLENAEGAGELLPTCGLHRMCAPCIQTAITLATNEEAHNPPKCCRWGDFRGPEIAPRLEYYMDRGVIDADTYLNYKIKEVEYSTRARDRVYCANPHCNAFLGPDLRDTSAGIATCPDCSTVTCTSCKHTVSESNGVSKHTCQREDDEAFAKAVKDLQYQQCPRCDATVELREACNHITCRCGADFCYICGGDWPCGRGCPRYGRVDLDRYGRFVQGNGAPRRLPHEFPRLDERRFGRVFPYGIPPDHEPEHDANQQIRNHDAGHHVHPEPDGEVANQRVEHQHAINGLRPAQEIAAQREALENRRAELRNRHQVMAREEEHALTLRRLAREIRAFREDMIAVRNGLRAAAVHTGDRRFEDQAVAHQEDIANRLVPDGAAALRAFRDLQGQQVEDLDAIERTARNLLDDHTNRRDDDRNAQDDRAERAVQEVLDRIARLRARQIAREADAREEIANHRAAVADRLVEVPAANIEMDRAFGQEMAAARGRLWNDIIEHEADLLRDIPNNQEYRFMFGGPRPVSPDRVDPTFHERAASQERVANEIINRRAVAHRSFANHLANVAGQHVGAPVANNRENAALRQEREASRERLAIEILDRQAAALRAVVNDLADVADQHVEAPAAIHQVVPNDLEEDMDQHVEVPAAFLQGRPNHQAGITDQRVDASAAARRPLPDHQAEITGERVEAPSVARQGRPTRQADVSNQRVEALPAATAPRDGTNHQDDVSNQHIEVPAAARVQASAAQSIQSPTAQPIQARTTENPANPPARNQVNPALEQAIVASQERAQQAEASIAANRAAWAAILERERQGDGVPHSWNLFDVALGALFLLYTVSRWFLSFLYLLLSAVLWFILGNFLFVLGQELYTQEWSLMYIHILLMFGIPLGVYLIHRG